MAIEFVEVDRVEIDDRRFGGGITWAIRESCSGPVPMWKSAPSGPATSSAKNVPSERPDTRLTISPSRYPWLIAW